MHRAHLCTARTALQRHMSLHVMSDEDSPTTLMGKSVLNKMSGKFPEWYTDKLTELFATYEAVYLQTPNLATVLIRTPPPLAFVSYGGDFALLARSERDQREVLTVMEAITNTLLDLSGKKLPRSPEQHDEFQRIDAVIGDTFNALITGAGGSVA